MWDYGEGDLHSSHTFQQAHTSLITGLATDTSQPSLAVSCSNDRSTLLWDFRELKPAKALFEGHDVAFSTVRWTDETSWNRLVAVGDVAGRVHFIDVRQPNVFLETIPCFDRKIQRISFYGYACLITCNGSLNDRINDVCVFQETVRGACQRTRGETLRRTLEGDTRRAKCHELRAGFGVGSAVAG